MLFVFKINYVLLIQYSQDAIINAILQSCAWILKYRPSPWHSELIALIEYQVHLVTVRSGWDLDD